MLADLLKVTFVAEIEWANDRLNSKLRNVCTKSCGARTRLGQRGRSVQQRRPVDAPNNAEEGHVGVRSAKNRKTKIEIAWKCQTLFQKIELEVPVFGDDLGGFDRQRQLLDGGGQRAAE